MTQTMSNNVGTKPTKQFQMKPLDDPGHVLENLRAMEDRDVLSKRGTVKPRFDPLCGTRNAMQPRAVDGLA